MPVTDPSATATVELSRAEQWVLHHVLLDAIGLADGQGGGQVGATEQTYFDAIRRLEEGTTEFTLCQPERIRRACAAHARTTNLAADRNLAAAVADRIAANFEDRDTMQHSPDEGAGTQ